MNNVIHALVAMSENKLYTFTVSSTFPCYVERKTPPLGLSLIRYTGDVSVQIVNLTRLCWVCQEFRRVFSFICIMRSSMRTGERWIGEKQLGFARHTMLQKNQMFVSLSGRTNKNIAEIQDLIKVQRSVSEQASVFQVCPQLVVQLPAWEGGSHANTLSWC